jgi:ABC-2 type transport system permease protein
MKPPVPFSRAARAVFELSLEGMLGQRRSLVMAILLGLPILFAVIYRVVLASKLPAQVTPFDLYGVIVAFYYVRNVMPLAALFHGSSLIADEVEGKTIAYLLSRPVTRASIFAGKFAAYLVATVALALPGLVVTYVLLMSSGGWAGLGRGLPDLWRDASVLVLGLAVYGAFFALLGVVLKRPTIPGLLFLFGWELLANLPGYMPRFTITAYLRSLTRHRPPDEGLAQLFGQVLPAADCLLALGAVFFFCLGLGIWIFSGREYVLDQ